jgi:hypothetical protein
MLVIRILKTGIQINTGYKITNKLYNTFEQPNYFYDNASINKADPAVKFATMKCWLSIQVNNLSLNFILVNINF